jgi:hypothetical protein
MSLHSLHVSVGPRLSAALVSTITAIAVVIAVAGAVLPVGACGAS